MTFFKDVEGEAAVIVQNGVYKQVPLATRGGYLFAKTSGGYVRLMEDGSTSKSGLRLEHLSWDGQLMRDPMGRLCTSETPKAKELTGPRADALLLS